jgi:hypothetical protein
MIDSLSRMRLAADQAALARGSLPPAAGSYALCGECYDYFMASLPALVSYTLDPQLDVGPLVDPILAHSSPGSKPYKQLCGLLTTMLKASAWACSPSVSSVVQDYAEGFCQRALRAVYKATSAVLAAATAASATAGSNPSTSRKGGSAKAAAGRAQRASDMLPWLVLLGRCCLQSQNHFEASGPQATISVEDRAQPQSSAAAENMARLMASSDSPLSCLQDEMRPEEINDTLVQELKSAAGDAKVWLAAGSIAAQLEAAGYDVQQLRKYTQGAEAALQDVVTVLVCYNPPNPPSSTSSTELAASTPHQINTSLSHQLHTLGLALSSLVHAHACNNPSCSNMSGPSEAKLVEGSSSKCSSCHAARYCNRACQKQHWKHHKPVCKGLADAGKGTK